MVLLIPIVQRTKTKNEATGTGVLPHLTDLAPSASYPPKSTSSCASVDGWSSQTSESTITIADCAPAGWRSVPATVDACSAAAAGGRSRSTPPSEAIESALADKAAEGGAAAPEFTWIDILTASQNLLGGVYRDPAVTREADPEGHAAREEDVNGMIAGALEAASELFFFAAPRGPPGRPSW